MVTAGSRVSIRPASESPSDCNRNQAAWDDGDSTRRSRPSEWPVQTLAGGEPRWLRNSLLLGEPTIQREIDGRFVGANAGTSFAAHHVAHAAAMASSSLERALGRPASANV